MQYLFSLFNYTSYENKTSIFHFSCSLPTEGTVNPSSDPSPLAHPSPEVHQWWGQRAEHFEHCIAWGSRSQPWDHNPWGAIPASQVLQGTVGKWWSEGTRAAGMAAKAIPRGRMVSASPGAVASPWHSWSVAANSSWAQVRAAAGPAWPPQGPGWARVQEVLGLEQLWHREHRYISVFGHAGSGSPNWSPRACQALDLATGPQPLCSLGCAAQHASVLHLRFLASRNKTGDKYLPKEMGAPSAPEVWGFPS